MFIKRWGCAVITTLCIFTAEAGNAAVVVDGGDAESGYRILR